MGWRWNFWNAVGPDGQFNLEQDTGFETWRMALSY